PALRLKSTTGVLPPVLALAGRHRVPKASIPDVRATALGVPHPPGQAIRDPLPTAMFFRIPKPPAAAPRDKYRAIVRAAGSTRQWFGSRLPACAAHATHPR